MADRGCAITPAKTASRSEDDDTTPPDHRRPVLAEARPEDLARAAALDGRPRWSPDGPLLRLRRRSRLGSTLARCSPSAPKHSVHSARRLALRARDARAACRHSPGAASLQGVCAGHDLEDLLRDLGLAGAVHGQRVGADQLGRRSRTRCASRSCARRARRRSTRAARGRRSTSSEATSSSPSISSASGSNSSSPSCARSRGVQLGELALGDRQQLDRPRRAAAAPSTKRL